MKVAVVTPYHRESEAWLRQCHDSVAAQTLPATHIMVADGHPSPAVAGWPVQHVTLPREHADNGDTPRAIGSLTAIGQDFDAIAYLDADNWYQPEHIAFMAEASRRTGAAIVTCNRTMHRLDGSLMYCDIEGNGRSLVDTSCFFLTRTAFRLAGLWGQIPRPLSPFCDRLFLMAVNASRLKRVHSAAPTVCFRTRYADHYRFCGEEPPAGAITFEDFAAAARTWDAEPAAVREAWQGYLASGSWA